MGASITEFKRLLSEGLLSGRDLASHLRQEYKSKLKDLDLKPYLKTILVGDDPPSEIYVNFKEKACNEVGIRNQVIRLEKDIAQSELISIINEINRDKDVNGILLQLPLPNHINESDVVYSISPEKDVDGLHYINFGKLFTGIKSFVPCTPRGIMKLLEYAGVELKGKSVVIIGRSNLVGKPLFRLFEREHATVTLCHSRTTNLGLHLKSADIIVAAVGRANLFTPDIVKTNTIIIDVGINRVDGKVVGDVNYNLFKDKVSLITPVPGGVGPMTIAMLLENTISAFEKEF